MARGRRQITVIDCHAAGDLSRVVVGGVLPPPGRTLADQARSLAARGDGLRRLLLSEPRGAPTMSADLIVPPVDRRADAGVIIMESMGYPPMSGSNAICAATVLLETGMVPITGPETALVLETPAGLIPVTAECAGGEVRAVRYESVPASVLRLGAAIDVPGIGRVAVDVVDGGVVYVVVGAEGLGLALAPEEAPELVALGRRIAAVAGRQLDIAGPRSIGQDPIAFVLFAAPVEHRARSSSVTRSAVYVAPATLCRSPTGTGTSARLALMAARGEIAAGHALENVSPLGTAFRGTLGDPTRVSGGPGAVRTTISGRAWITGVGQLIVAGDDPFPEGFALPPAAGC